MKNAIIHGTTAKVWYNARRFRQKEDDMSEYCKYCGQEYQDVAIRLRG